jgi:hypothetical protein
MSTTIEKLQKLINTKKALQTAINNKGGAITDDTPFDEYPLAVDTLSTGGNSDVSFRTLTFTKDYQYNDMTTFQYISTYEDRQFIGKWISSNYEEPILLKLRGSMDGTNFFNVWACSFVDGSFDPEDKVFSHIKFLVVLDEYELKFSLLNANQSSDADGAIILNRITTREGDTDVTSQFLPAMTKLELFLPIEKNEPTLVAGLYETGTENLITSWEDLLANGTVHVDNGVVYTNFDTEEGVNGSSEALTGDLILPNDGTITSIGDASYDEEWNLSGRIGFEGCENLTNVVIPQSVKTISDESFAYCISLTNIVIPDSVTSIGKYALGGCALTDVVIPNGVTSIEEGAFDSCENLTNITFSNNVTSIGEYAFAYCISLTNIIIPESVTSIGDSAFYNCSNLTNITIPESVTSIGDSAFDGCNSLTNVTIGDGVTSIGNYAFNLCINLPNIIIPDSVTSIGDYAFNNCASLTNVTIGDGVTSIGEKAFAISALENVYYNGTIEDWCNIKFDSTSSNPISFGDHFYMLDSNDKYYEVTKIEIPNTITLIHDYQLCGFDNLTDVVIPDNVTSIGEWAFFDCRSLTNVTIGNNVASIGGSAFRGCDSLTNITIPNSVTSIKQYGFGFCRNLTQINYNGTKAQWKAISLESGWDGTTGDYIITCTDGTIAKDGTES